MKGAYHNKECEETTGNIPMEAQVLVQNGRGIMIVSFDRLFDTY